MSVCEWLAPRAKEFEVTAQRRDVDGPMVDRALEVVRRFIVERRLILFGGLAIDYALRLRGSRIYPDDERPDFDFLSTTSVDDAYDLAERLVAAGFPNVNAVRAIHVQTMKVRVDFVWVADIGYVPPAVFARIPTLDYGGMRIVHPDFQRIDQHLAFCFPFNGAPREDVFHRWKKDLKRFNIFEEFYPITAAETSAEKSSKTSAEKSSKTFLSVAAEVPVAEFALHGFAAYAALHAALGQLAAAFGTTIGCGAPALRVSVAHNSARTVITADVPAGLEPVLHVVTPVAAAEVSGRQYRPYLDILPDSVRVGDSLQVLSTNDRLLAVSRMRLGDVPVAVVTPHYLLIFFLFMSHQTEGAARETYRAYYVHVLDMINEAEALVASRDDGAGDALALFMASPFAPTVQTMGSTNHDASYTIRMATTAARLKDLPPEGQRRLEGLPQNYYPSQGKPRPTFSYGVNDYFLRTGEPYE